MARSSPSTPVVRVVWGTGTGPTDVAAYDAALAAAGVHNYNLVTVSSIVPPGASIEPVGTAPDLGAPGNRLTVVQGRHVVEGPGRATAGIGWITGDGPGVIYEAGGSFEQAVAERRIRAGLDAAKHLRDGPFEQEDVRVTSREIDRDEWCAAVALACFGDSRPIL